MGISHEQPRSRNSASSYPLRHKPIIKPALGFQSTVWVLLLGSFWFFTSIWKWEGRASHAGLGTCPSPRPTAPPLPAAYVYNVQSVPPSRNKESPHQ